MPDTPDHDPDTTGQRSLSDRLKALEEGDRAHTDHRTKVNTLLSVVGGAVFLVMGALAQGAVSTRDAALSNQARITVIEQRVAAVDARDQRRDDSERTSREQLVEIRADVRALREQLDTLTRALAGRDDRTPRPR